MQTLPIHAIVAAWRDALAADAAIEAYCQAHYGKPLKVFVGLDLRKPPEPGDAPLVIIRPGAKTEGDMSPYSYVISVSWSIFNDRRTTAANVIEMAGVQEVDELGQLIYSCLAAVSPNHPITSIEYDVDSIEFFPLHAGEMTLTTEIEPAIGGSISYP